MAGGNAMGREIQMTLACGKCGSRAVIGDRAWNNSMGQRILALKCLTCGNRQEEGVPCRWPFFEKSTDKHGKKRAAA
jgi:hypothetical protein